MRVLLINFRPVMHAIVVKQNAIGGIPPASTVSGLGLSVHLIDPKSITGKTQKMIRPKANLPQDQDSHMSP